MPITVLQTFKIVREILRWRRITALLSGLLLASASQVWAAEDQLRGPDVVIIAGKDKVVYEFRQNGQLRMVRVVPKWGKPYYLVPRDPTKGYGDLERADMLIPQWVIAEF
ncbi:MAG: DUF2782 domain-containing protein [Pseudomonadota bacterium]